jgi:hypothetical protein
MYMYIIRDIDMFMKMHMDMGWIWTLGVAVDMDIYMGIGHMSLDTSVATLPGTDVHRLGGSNLGLLHRSQIQ